MLCKLGLLFLGIQECFSVGYHVDDEVYEKFPPLFGIDSNYDSCLRNIGGIYCVAKFDLDDDPDNEIIQTVREYSHYDLRHYNHSYIDRAVCVSRTCKKFVKDKNIENTLDLKVVLEECINDTIWREYGVHVKLADIYYCDKHGDQLPVDLGDYILGAVLIIFLSLNLVGSVYDAWQDKTVGPGKQYLLSFSIFRNWKQLTSTDVDPQYERMKGIHGLKSIATFFVGVAHVMWLITIGFTDNPKDFEMVHDRLHYQVIFNGMVMVQIFFVISGCLLTFHKQLMSEIKPLTWNMLPKILLMRWVRLTPGNALTILFTATWLRHLGTGPLWKMYVMTVANQCRVHWWQHLLYFNNYVTEDKYCELHTWHISSEMQLFSVGLAVYVATASRRRYIALFMLVLIGMITPALHVWLQDLDALVMHRPEFHRVFSSDTFWFLYVPGHNNLSSYAIGMIVGLVSYNCVKNKVEYTNSKVLKFLIWSVPLGIVGIILSGTMFYVDERPHVIIRMIYAAIHRPAFGVMIALLILNIVMKFENSIRGILEWRIWVFTSQLSYSIYLLHLNIVFVLLGLRTQLSHVSFFYVVINHFGVFSLTFLVSIPFYLLFEAPIRSLLKVYTKDSSQEKKIK